MAGQGRGNKGKMPISRGRSRLLQPGDLALESNRRRLQRQGSPPPVQPTPPIIQETPPPVQTTPPPVPDPTHETFTFIPNPGHMLSRQFEQSSSHFTTHEPSSTVPVPQQSEDHQEDEEEEHQEDEEHHQPERDADGKVIIRPFGRGLTPSKDAADAIKAAIRKQFRGAYHCWSETPKDVKDDWWRIFKGKLSWERRDHEKIKMAFKQRCAKRLSDMLTKARKKRLKPGWIGEEAWNGLLAHWESEDFKKLSAQNKTNRASNTGGAVHTTGRRAHHDMAQDLAKKLGRSVHPDELFLATHKKKSGDWVDRRAERTYDNYQERLSKLTQINDASLGETQEVNGETRLRLWQEAAGGKSRGRCYGTGDLSTNLRHGVSQLTQEPQAPLSRNGEFESEVIEAFRQEAIAARAEAAEAKQRVTKAEQHAQQLENQLQTVVADFQQRMTALERQSGGASCSVSQNRRTPRHPHYDDDLDDQSLDNASPDAHRF